jgi:3,4-dihydroxy 2-butanone 4-phosphate synthase / GTP cyclohydrolase II
MATNITPLSALKASAAPVSVDLSSAISCTTEIIAEMKAGRMVVLVDEEDRENEGDLVLAADHVSPEAINFMARFGRGLICLTLTEERCDQLGLNLMVTKNGTKHSTAFTSSIEAAEGVTTGISAADRSRTVQAAVSVYAKPSDIVQPGHIFPLRAQAGGVLMRAGHTEAGCDLSRLAGLTPAAVICEIMKDDGEMARLPDLVIFAKEHGLKIGTIADLIHYRSANESIIERLGEREVLTPFGPKKLVAYRDKPSGAPHFALVHGTVDPDGETAVRVHEPLSVIDLLDMNSSTHSWPLLKALEMISKQPSGVMVLLNCNQSAENTFAQFEAMLALDQNRQVKDTLAKRQAKMDLRTYGVGAQILKDLGVGKMRLLSHPRKMPSMAGFDLQVAGYEQLK